VSGKGTLFETTWVHVFEEDGPDGAVYRPEDGEVPLSRRPRERLSLSPDGSARLVVGGPDDRLREVEARWTEKEGEITVSVPARAAAGSATTLRVRVQSSDCLLVRR
jgi:hypothetical protein